MATTVRPYLTYGNVGATVETHMSQTPKNLRALALILLIPVVVAVELALFAWPQARSEPRDLPIGLAGARLATALIEQRLAQSEGAFDVHRYADEAAAREAIEDRDAYGAIVGSRTGTTLLTASAASPAVAQLLEQRVASLAPSREAGGDRTPPQRVVDVVPSDPDDPRGAALSASVLPLLLAGIVTGLVVASVTRPGLGQAGALAGASALGGLAAVAVAQAWLGVIGGSWLANAGVLSLTVMAISSVAAGLTALVGRTGLVATALLMVMLGNPWSGISSAPELLPRPVGDIGQLLPPGAGGNALRGTAFFDGAGSAEQLLVLLAWAVLGLAAVGAAALRERRAPATAGRVPGLGRAPA